MKPWLRLTLLFLLAVAVAHVVTVLVIPRAIMAVAFERIEKEAGGTNRLIHQPAITVTNQRIVRSSPDLAYSVCVIDLSGGPVRVRLSKGSDYLSAAFYGADTSNFATFNDRTIDGMALEALVLPPGDTSSRVAAKAIEAPSSRILLLVRRLAPDPARFKVADAERAGDVCETAVGK
jgi:uncharacterized membrane protein